LATMSWVGMEERMKEKGWGMKGVTLWPFLKEW
jgi:hypothetical protein